MITTPVTPFNSIPTLETERLILRRLTRDDAPSMFVFRSDKEVMRYIPCPLATSVDEVCQVIDMMNDFADRGEKLNWGITLKDSDEVIGNIGYVNLLPEHRRAEIGYSLSRAYHRKGIMKEALLRMIDYGFQEMKLHTIMAIIDAENEASGALLEHVGFVKEAYFREDFCYNGEFRNSTFYGLFAHEVKR